MDLFDAFNQAETIIGEEDFDEQAFSQIPPELFSGLLEAIKYITKPSNLLGLDITHDDYPGITNADYISIAAAQLKNARMISTGGIIKNLLAFEKKDKDEDEDSDDLLGHEELGFFEESLGDLNFIWVDGLNRYVLNEDINEN